MEVRPTYLRNIRRIKAHVLVAILAPKITRVFKAILREAFGTTDEDVNTIMHYGALQSLAHLTHLIYDAKGTR